MKFKKAIITGITGQDGSYLAEFLLKKNILYTELKEDLHLLIHLELTIFTKIRIIKIDFFYTMETYLILTHLLT